jgi:hypothetical protein
MHQSQICCLDRIVGIESVGDPMIVVVVSTARYFHLVSYASTLTTFSVVSLCRWRLSPDDLSWVCCDVWLGASSMGCVVSDVACGISGAISRRVS